MTRARSFRASFALRGCFPPRFAREVRSWLSPLSPSFLGSEAENSGFTMTKPSRTPSTPGPRWISDTGVVVPTVTEAQMREIDRIAIEDTGPT